MATRRVFFTISLLLLFLCSAAAPALAADEVVVTVSGVAGDMDSGKRDPELSVGRTATLENVKLVADAFVPNKAYARYPIRFEWYVNQQLMLTQIRSPELTGPVGIDIPPTMATMPFNYTVVACLIHPNHSYCTVVNGAAEGPDVTVKYNCEASLTDAELSETTTYTASEVVLESQGEDAYAFSFTGKTADGTEEAAVAGTLKVSGDTASANVSITPVDGTGTPVDCTGTATTGEDGKLASFDVKSADGGTALKCTSSS